MSAFALLRRDGAGDLAHGVMEGQAEHLDVEVNGIAGQIFFGPAPVGVVDDETGIGRQDEVARLTCDELESALVEQRNKRGQARGADLLTRPTAALAAIGAEYPLASKSLAGCRCGIIAAQQAVPVQCAHSFAVRARPLLERKSCVFRSGSSRTK